MKNNLKDQEQVGNWPEYQYFPLSYKNRAKVLSVYKVVDKIIYTAKNNTQESSDTKIGGK